MNRHAATSTGTGTDAQARAAKPDSSQSPHLGALKYHGVFVAVPAARTPPHTCPRVVFPLPPLRRALPAQTPVALRTMRSAAARAPAQSCGPTCARRASSIRASTASFAGPHTRALAPAPRRSRRADRPTPALLPLRRVGAVGPTEVILFSAVAAIVWKHTDLYDRESRLHSQTVCIRAERSDISLPLSLVSGSPNVDRLDLTGNYEYTQILEGGTHTHNSSRVEL